MFSKIMIWETVDTMKIKEWNPHSQCCIFPDSDLNNFTSSWDLPKKMLANWFPGSVLYWNICQPRKKIIRLYHRLWRNPVWLKSCHAKCFLSSRLTGVGHVIYAWTCMCCVLALLVSIRWLSRFVQTSCAICFLPIICRSEAIWVDTCPF